MPLARPAALLLALSSTLTAARADVGGTLSVQTDARERGLSYSGRAPAAQLALAWDGSSGWYAGTQLAQARFDARRHGARWQVYAGRVFELAPGLDGEAGVTTYRFGHVGYYDYREVYAALLGERWHLRVYHSPDYYGLGRASVYGEFALRWPLAKGWNAFGQAGLLHARGQPWGATGTRRATRADLRAGASWQLGAGSELSLALVAAERGGPALWGDSARRRAAVLGLTVAF